MTEGTPDRLGLAESPCPECGALVSGRVCFLCGHTATDVDVPPSKASISIPHQRAAQTFRLSSLFLFLTLVAVCFGAIKAAPGFGIPIAVLATMAFSRAAKMTKGDEATGATVTSGHQIMSFVSSLVLAFLLMAAAIVALGGACATLVGAFTGQERQFVLGLLAAIIGIPGYLLLRHRWIAAQVEQRR